MTGDQAIKILSRLDDKGFILQEEFKELKDYIYQTETFRDNLDRILNENLKCRKALQTIYDTTMSMCLSYKDMAEQMQKTAIEALGGN